MNIPRPAFKRVTSVLSATAILALIGAQPTSAKTWLIKPDQSGDAPTIQAGIDSAAAGDTLALEDGTFTGPGNKDISFDHKSIVLRSLSDDPSSCLIDCEANAPVFFHAFVIDTVAEPGVVLRGFSMTGADGHFGGAIVCKRSRVDVSNCVFYDNFATYGGGMSIDDYSVVTLTGCVFSGNGAVGDGAISFYGVELYADDCIFEGGEGIADGPGGIWASDGYLTLEHCLFANNWARWAGGALELRMRAKTTINNCTFVRNKVDESGGSVLSIMSDSLTSVNRSIFAFNGPGAAIAGCGDSLYVGCSDFYGNFDGDWSAWTTCLAGADTLNGNFKLDPLFCDTLNGDYSLAALSPCMPDYNTCRVLIGAYGLGCEQPTGLARETAPKRLGIDLHVFPNPFNPRTVIFYDLPSTAYTTVSVYDVRGRLVSALIDEFQNAGPHRVVWDGHGKDGVPAASGVYFLRVSSGGSSRSAKMLLLK